MSKLMRAAGAGMIAVGALTKSEWILILSILIQGLGLLLDYLKERKE